MYNELNNKQYSKLNTKYKNNNMQYPNSKLDNIIITSYIIIISIATEKSRRHIQKYSLPINNNN